MQGLQQPEPLLVQPGSEPYRFQKKLTPTFRDTLFTKWKRFRSDFELYNVATGFAEKPKPVQACLLVYCMGYLGRKQLNKAGLNISLKAEALEDPQEVIEAINTFLNPPPAAGPANP